MGCDVASPRVAVFTTQDFAVSEGGQATFISNLDPYLRRRYCLHYVFLPENAARKNVLPDRLLYFVYLLRFLARNSCLFDAAISHTFEASWLLSFFHLPFLHVNHGNSNPFSISKFSYGRLLAGLYPAIMARVARHASCLLTVGEPLEGFQRVSNPVSIPPDIPRGLPRKGIVFGGRLEQVKNVDRLLRIYALLPEDVRGDHPFFIIGRGTQEQRLRRLAADLGINATCVWLGFLNLKEALRVYAGAALLLMASSTEGFPMVMAECLSVGTPVVSSSVGAIPSVITDGWNGCLLSPSDPDQAYARAIRKVLGSSEVFSQRALASACVFSADKVAGVLIDRLDSVLKGGEVRHASS